MSEVEPVVQASAVAKSFGRGRLRTQVLSAVDLQVRAGESLAIVGASGSGKSTLLHLLGGLELPDAGSIHVQGQDMRELGEAARGRLRNQALGFVYQFHHLLPEFTAWENVAMPLIIRREPIATARAAAMQLLERVGLGPRALHKPGELSGGERQRVAVARALINRPACILADEPTGNLDARNAEQVFDLLLSLNREFAVALIVVTHDEVRAGRMQRTCVLHEGCLQAKPAA